MLITETKGLLMSAVKKTAKASLYMFSLLVIVFIAGAIYIYVNMNSLALQITEQYASQALGVPVKIGAMDIKLEQKSVTVSDIRVSNPEGYKKPNAITIKKIEVAGENFSKELLTFKTIKVDGTDVYLEVVGQTTNLGDMKNNIGKNNPAGAQASTASDSNKANASKDPKVIIRKMALTQAQLHPSVTLIKHDFKPIKTPDIHLTGIGEKENGILAQEAMEQVMSAVLQNFNNTANKAGFLEGLSLESLNDIGLSTADVFKSNIKKTYDQKVDGVKEGFEQLKDMFE